MISDRLPAMSLAVVGAQYPNPNGSNRRFEILLCKPGDPIELRPEPKNKHDERAVAVYSERGVQIGYLTAERCGRVGRMIREGREVIAVFQSAGERGGWIRVAFDGEQPAVRDDTRQQQVRCQGDEGAQADFYPDEEWPED